MEQQRRQRNLTSIELDDELREWIDEQVARRIIEKRPHGERSMAAVIREVLHDARQRDVIGKVSVAA
jgi:Arc/MetJ-type ribon-helix-helix transcriptional regulator